VRIGALVAILIFAAGASRAEEPKADGGSRRSLAAARASVVPTVDGDLSDAIWQTAPRAEVFTDRNRGEPAGDQTIAWIAYDDACIYVAFDCRDAVPSAIVGRETVRDAKYQNWEGDTEDNVEVVFDLYLSHKGDHRARFSTNPLGTPSARNSGGRANKLEWKGDWRSAARRTATGWAAEMAIPWQMLSYPAKSGPTDVGINFRRWQHRLRIRSEWSYEGPQGFQELQGHWTGVRFPREAFRPALSLLPYAVGGLGQGGAGLQSGLDLRYAATPDLTGVATINPDFGTIEGAVEGIQFSRSERWVPERRPFFLEGNDYLRAGTEYAIGPFFYPNRIRAVDIGTKVYGKVTPRDTLGFLHTLDFGRRSDLVAKLRHDLSPTAAASVFVSTMAADDDNNTAIVAEQSVRRGKFGLASQWAFSGGNQSGGTAQQVNLYYEDKNTFHSFQYIGVAPDFRAANGLTWHTDYRGAFLYHVWDAEWPKGPLRGFRMELNPLIDWHTDGRPFRRRVSWNGGFETRSDWLFWTSASYGTFDGQLDNTYGMGVTYGASNRFRRVGFSLNRGRQAGRAYAFVGPHATFRILRRLDIGYGGAVQEFDGTTQQHIVSANYEVSPTRSVGGRLVTEDGRTNWYLSYRHSGGKGAETFVMLGDPNANVFASRVRVKMVFAL
jgi:hypothetical protein